MLKVAVIGKSVGLKGFLKLHDHSDFPEQFKKGAKFFDKDNNLLIIKEYDKNNFLVKFENFENIDDAKKLINKEIFVSKECSRKLCKQDEYLYVDIIGLDIFQDSEFLGKIQDIEYNGINHLFYIKTDDRLCSLGLPSNFYVPYSDSFVLKIDLDTKRVLCKAAREILENS